MLFEYAEGVTPDTGRERSSCFGMLGRDSPDCWGRSEAKAGKDEARKGENVEGADALPSPNALGIACEEYIRRKY